MHRGKRGKLGEYMAFYTVSFSISHVIGHNAGMQMVDKLGYDITWTIITVLAIICILFLIFLKHSLNKETS